MLPRKPISKKLQPQVGARVPDALLIEIKILATRQHRRFQELVEEALRDLVKKYHEPQPKG